MKRTPAASQGSEQYSGHPSVHPEKSLWAAVIAQGVRDGDEWYLFKSQVFERHCEWVGADPDMIRRELLLTKPLAPEWNTLQYNKELQKMLEYLCLTREEVFKAKSGRHKLTLNDPKTLARYYIAFVYLYIYKSSFLVMKQIFGLKWDQSVTHLKKCLVRLLDEKNAEGEYFRKVLSKFLNHLYEESILDTKYDKQIKYYI